MAERDQLLALARAHDIEPGYHDIWGNRHEASDAALRGILASMGCQTGNAAQVDAARQIRGLDLTRDARDASDRTQHAAGDDPARAQAADEEEPEGRERELAQLRQRALVDPALELAWRDDVTDEQLTVRCRERLFDVRALRHGLRIE